jgi:hypothetical protein
VWVSFAEAPDYSILPPSAVGYGLEGSGPKTSSDGDTGAPSRGWSTSTASWEPAQNGMLRNGEL